MRFTATFDMDNASFEEDPAIELDHVLDRGVNDIKLHWLSGDDAEGKLRDSNGNTVGEWRIETDWPEGAHAADFAGAVCAGCDDPLCDGELYIHSRCHPSSRTWTVLREGGRVADVICAECESRIVRLVLAP